ncbi:MAG: UTP--glucose-1-phosphate uridylyltransferase [Planctomycetota bacterium]
MMPIDETRAALSTVDQDHLLAFASELSAEERASLLNQIASLDVAKIPSLVSRYVRNKPVFELPAGIDAASYYPAHPDDAVRPYDAATFREAGESALRRGEVACFTVAGGQGSRLGYDGPKGCFPAGAVTKKSLFEIFAEGVLATGRKYGTAVPWYVMTSPLNHEATVAFFREHRYFGLDPADVMFFPQGTMPSFDMASGKILLAAKHEIATNPDGHGGSLTALHTSGALEDMTKRGIEHISYFQVDNTNVKVADPLVLGLHAAAPDSSGELSSKMLPKAYPEEKLGLFATADTPHGTRVCVIEYSDMPMELQRETLPDGRLRFLAGSPAIHVFGRAFVEKVNTDTHFELPYHRAEKKVACIDAETGEKVSPSSPNGVKLERFVFDALPLAEQSIILETSRVEEFAPIKNAEGADSAESSARLQTQKAAGWLEAVGVRVPKKDDGSPDCVLEISPLTALEPADLKKADLPAVIEPGARLAL